MQRFNDYHGLIVALFVLLTVATDGACQTEDVTASADTFLTEATYYGGPDGTNGSNTVLAQIGKENEYGYSWLSWPLVKFDLSVYQGRTVAGSNGTVGLYLRDKHPASSNPSQDVTVYESLVAWDETTACWNNFGGTPGVQSGEISTELAVRTVTWITDQLRYVEWSIPASVLQRWIDNPATNKGLLFKSLTDLYDQDFLFDSREASQKPRLVFDLVAQAGFPRFCAVGWNGRFTHIDPNLGQVSPTRTDLPQYLQALSHAPDGRLFAGRSGDLFMIDPLTGDTIHFISVTADIRGMAFSPSGILYVTAGITSAQQELRIVNTLDGSYSVVGALWGDGTAAQGLAFSPSGQLYAISPHSAIAGTYDLFTIDTANARMYRIAWHDTPGVSQSIAFTPDGSLYAIGQNAFARLDPTDGSILGTPLSLAGDYRALEFVGDTVSNIVAAQQPGTKLIDVYYDLSVAPGTSTSTISITVRDAGIDTGASSFSGDVGAGIAEGAGKHVVWNAGLDWNEHLSSDVVVHISAQNKPVGVDICSVPINSDTRDYTLTVSSDYGNPLPSIGDHTYAWHASVTCTNALYALDGGTSKTCRGWIGTGSVPANGTEITTGQLTLADLESSIAWTWGADTDDDGDGLLNGMEVLVHDTDPNKRDTDGDYFDDGFELGKGWNPKNDGERDMSDNLIATISASAESQSSTGLFTFDSIRNLYVDAPLIEVQGNTVTLQLQLQSSDDLHTWHPFGDPAQWQDTVTDKCFYRLFFQTSE